MGELESKITYNQDHDLIVVLVRGPVTGPGLTALFQKVVDDPARGPRTGILLDATDARGDAIAASDIWALANLVKNHAEKVGIGGVAVVVARQVDYGLARMWQLMTESETSLRAGVFRQRQEALEWFDGRPGL